MEDNLKKGDSSRITRDYLDSLLVETRYIDSGVPDMTFKLFGQTFASPIMTAAFSHLTKLFKVENGMVEMAKGANAANVAVWAGMGDDREMEDMASTGAKIIKIIKPYEDEDIIFHQIKVAEENGAIAVGMDIDHSFNKEGFFDTVFNERMHSKSTDDLRRYAEATALPFIIKGVSSVRDAERCIEANAGGILVSHHHGMMDYSLPPLMILPEILKTVGGKMPVFADCGIDSGMDAFKALAIGADGVCVGRTILGDLVKEGAEGVTKRFIRMNNELREVMARTGTLSLSDMDPTVIHKIY